jgi:hypothetical protein
MKTMLALVSAPFLLAACASPQAALEGASPAASAPGQGTYYCWKDRLSVEGDNLVCNWESSAADACRSNGVVSIPRSSVAKGPDNTRRCENGEWLVVVTTK